MNEQGEPHPADKILGADWRPPNRVRLEQAWDEHDQVELLNERKAERDQDGQPVWDLVRIAHEDDWVEYWQRPTDAHVLDPREPIRVCAWPESVETKADAEVDAIVDEHDLGPSG